ncbi:phosphohydrolase [Pseudomonas nitroreducens]|uniref:phosphohydrolase n=1 Tax=Pseudomonas TaxID=286 RepID=UPI0007EE907D|nr:MULTISPECIES: phosphohydrolase [Pseudomonas]NMZ72947.1 phosphohydrolase [Pseudomonas nitroreducens]OBY59438.1 phosphohydrolase [Pseudomonas sp. AU12215]
MSWILTNSGQRFDILEPNSGMVHPQDIAHSLAMQCRFNGHCGTFYSVAQHCIIVASLVPDEHKLAALLHDATEAYIGDIVRPLKQAVPDLRQIEHRIWHAICARFDIDPVLPACIHDADMIALATERRDLMPEHQDEWECLAGTQPIQQFIRAWSADEARLRYWQDLLQLLATTHRARAAA